MEIEADTVKDVFRGADVLIVDVVKKVEEVDGLEVVMEKEVVKEVDEVVEVVGVVGVVIE
jgi:hypothetical protein